MIDLQFEQATCKNSMLAWVSVRQPIDSPSDARARALRSRNPANHASNTAVVLTSITRQL
jgi:hypothetical protein